MGLTDKELHSMRLLLVIILLDSDAAEVGLVAYHHRRGKALVDVYVSVF